MTRLPNWEERLSAFLIANREREFLWGQWDCITMACSAVEAMTGHDPAAAYRGRYSSAAGAKAILRELGKGTLLRTINAEFVRKPVGYAQRGDLVWRDGAVGVCLGSTALFVGEADEAIHRGFISAPRADFQKAWAV